MTMTTARTPAVERLALFLSVALSPFLIVPLFCLLFVGACTDDPAEFCLLAFMCIFFSIGLPAIYIGWNVYQGHITDIHVQLREQRSTPFLIGIVGLACLSLTLYLMGAPSLLVRVSAVTCFQGSVFAAISRHWKISMHTGVLASMLGCSIELLKWSPLCLTSVIPLIWARRIRKRHYLSQGSVGAILGYALSAYPLRLMEYFWPM